MLRAAAQVEKMGIPTVSLIGNAFMRQADVVSRGLGLPLAYAEYPGAPMVDGPEELSTKVRNTLAPGVIKGLAQGRDTASTASVEAELAQGSIVMNGTLDEIQEYFYRKLWTDGMPKLVAEGTLPKEYHESDDPERLVRVFIHEATTGILVAGDPGRNQSRGYMGNHDQGPPTSRKIVFNSAWQELMKNS